MTLLPDLAVRARTMTRQRTAASLACVYGLSMLTGCGGDPPGTPVLRLERISMRIVAQTGATTTEDLIVYNDGNGVLEISDIATTIPWVTASPKDTTIAPHSRGGTTLVANAINVGAGSYEGRISLQSNDPEHASLIVPLTVDVAAGPPPTIIVTPTLFILPLMAGESTEVHCLVSNSGTQTGGVTEVTSGCSWVSAEPTSLSLDPGQTEPITLTVRTVGLAEGQYQCVVYMHTTDPRAPRYDVVVDLTVGAGSGVSRVVVAEEFTGTWCYYCPGAMMGLHTLQQLVGFERLAMVAYHLSDDFAILANQDRAQLYGVSGIPHVWFDGTLNRLGGQHDQAIDYTTEYNQRASRLAPLAITLSLDDYDPQRGAGVLRATCRNVGRGALDTRFLTVMTGVDTLYSWQDFDHLYGTAISFPGGSSGQALSLQPGEADTLLISFSTPASWIDRQREMVGFAQDVATREIHQGAVLRLP